ncbi:MAG: PSD1 and planctomycete cytochrome C domain-containing protein, partial [Planctomycetota bacterium]
MHVRLCLVLTLLLPVLVVDRIEAQTNDEIRFFETKIRPVLVKHCYECHSTIEEKARGGLKLDTRDASRSGGDTAPAIVPRSPTKSLLYESIQYDDAEYPMPPKGKLPDHVIADFRRWIEMGAPDPRVIKHQPNAQSEIDIEEGKTFWAYQPPVMQETLELKTAGWPRTEIDRFVIAKLDEHGLHPVPDASSEVLIRRLFFNLIGLPPSSDQAVRWKRRMDAAIDEDAKQAVVAELISELLDSPHYGERWGRHWMDVARYAESTGGDQNNIYQHAWRYRDYVIDSFNDDKPFDQFIREQIAGDLLPIADEQEWADNVIASGFLALGVKLVGEEDQQKFFADLVDEQIDATTRAFLATTVACARCHDHKFDPIPQQDYYALAGIFRSTETHYGLLKAQARQATTLLDLTGMGPPPGTPKLDQKELAALIQERDDAAQAVTDAMNRIRSGENVFRGMLRRLRSQRDETEAALQAYSNRGEPRVFAMGTQDRDHVMPTRLLIRGEIDKPAQLVPRGVLQVLSPKNRYQFNSRVHGSGRLEFANWIAAKTNPLTARVIANSVWHWMFGQGLVRTVDDFGFSGDRPTHPELLDYLAIRLIENDWSIKWLVKEIAQSRTWQLASS